MVWAAAVERFPPVKVTVAVVPGSHRGRRSGMPGCRDPGLLIRPVPGAGRSQSATTTTSPAMRLSAVAHRDRIWRSPVRLLRPSSYTRRPRMWGQPISASTFVSTRFHSTSQQPGPTPSSHPAHHFPQPKSRFNTHSLPRPPQTPAAPFKRLYRKCPGHQICVTRAVCRRGAPDRVLTFTSTIGSLAPPCN